VRELFGKSQTPTCAEYDNVEAVVRKLKRTSLLGCVCLGTTLTKMCNALWLFGPYFTQKGPNPEQQDKMQSPLGRGHLSCCPGPNHRALPWTWRPFLSVGTPRTDLPVPRTPLHPSYPRLNPVAGSGGREQKGGRSFAWKTQSPTVPNTTMWRLWKVKEKEKLCATRYGCLGPHLLWKRVPNPMHQDKMPTPTGRGHLS